MRIVFSSGFEMPIHNSMRLLIEQGRLMLMTALTLERMDFDMFESGVNRLSYRPQPETQLAWAVEFVEIMTFIPEEP